MIAVIYCRFCLSNKIGKNYSCHRFNNGHRTRNHKDRRPFPVISVMFPLLSEILAFA
jgi:hypothetical protein